jgi:hypothetical protein
MKAQSLAIDTREDALFPVERTTLCNLSQRQAWRTARLITRTLDSSGVLQMNVRDILHTMTEFLSQRYKATIVNCECLRRMEHEMFKVMPTAMREDLVVEFTDMELYLTVRQGTPNKSPGWNGINLEFYKKYWGVI